MTVPGAPRWTLALLFAAALAARLAGLAVLGDQPLNIVDERHYQAIAVNLVSEGEFALQPGHPTAIRPPLYPLVLAGVYRLQGGFDPFPVRVIQSLLGLLLGWLTYLWSRPHVGGGAAAAAAALVLFYPSLFVFDYLILSEVLFGVLFLGGLLCAAAYLRTGALALLPLGGALLGLSALTRSVTYPMVLPFAGLLVLLSPARRLRTAAGAALLVAAFAAVLSPWALRNYRLLDSFVPVDTMGGLNLYMGNFEHTPLHRAWAAVDNTGDARWHVGHEDELEGLDEAQKQRWAGKQAARYMRANPGLTALRSGIKAANLWGLERTVLGGMKDGLFPSLQGRGVQIAAGLAILGVYAFVAVAGFFGLVYRLFTERTPEDLVVGFLVVYFTAVHAVVFGHPRYHLPLIPLLCVYAGWSVVHLRAIRARRPRGTRLALAGVVAVFAGVWSYDVLIGSHDRLAQLWSRLW